MAEYNDLVAMLRWLIQNRIAPKGDYVRGLLGNGHGKVQVPSAPDHSYVRPNRSVDQVFEIFNKTVPNIDGLPVLMGEFPWQPGLTQIIDVDWETYLGSAGWAGYSRTGPHGDTHVWRDGYLGVDTFNVHRRQIAEMRSYPVGSGSMSFNVAPLDYLYYGEPKSWPGLPGIDLSPAVPSTGSARWMLSYLDPVSNTVGVVTGTIEVDSLAVSPPRPGLPTGSWLPSAYIRLQGGQATLGEYNFADARPLWVSTSQLNLGDLGDVGIPTGTPRDGDFLRWDDGDARWEPQGLGELSFGGEDLLLYLDFQRWVGESSGTSRANYIVGSHLERGQVGAAADDYDDRGSLHFEAGRWRNQAALVLEEARTNICTNPLQRDTDADGIADGWVYWDDFGSGGAATPTIIDHPDKLRKGWLQQYAYTATAGDSGDQMSHYFDTSAASFAAGDDATFSVVLRVLDLTGCTLWLYIQAMDNVGGSLGSETMDLSALADSRLRRFSFTRTSLPANTDHLRLHVYVLDVDDGDSFDFCVGEVNIEKDDCPTTLVHGGMGDGYSWTGTPHASISDRRQAALLLDEHGDLVSGNNALSFRVVARMPYDHDAVWPVVNINRLFDLRGADDNNRVYLGWDQANNRWTFYVNGAERATYSQEFSEGDWLEFIVNLDFAADTYQVWIDGSLVGSSTVALTAPTGVVDWAVGGLYSGNAEFGGFWFAEYAVFDRWLEPWEINSLHARGQPVADFFTSHRSFTYPGTAAGRYQLTYDYITDSALTTYTEVDAGNRLTFAGNWARSRVFFEVVGDCPVTGSARLAYYDVKTAAWWPVPESQLPIAAYDRVRTVSPLCLPLTEFEYRLEQLSLDIAQSVTIRRAAIIVQPSGEEDL